MKLPASEIKLNDKNPRFVKDEQFNILVQSLKDFPEMSEVREVVINQDYVILGGNMRYRAMIEAGWTEIPVRIVDWSQEKQNEFILKDNITAGNWDWNVLANEWETADLDRWGLSVERWQPVINPTMGNVDLSDTDFAKVQDDLRNNIIGGEKGKKVVICPDCYSEFEIDDNL